MQRARQRGGVHALSGPTLSHNNSTLHLARSLQGNPCTALVRSTADFHFGCACDICFIVFMFFFLFSDPWFKPLRECISLVSLSCDDLLEAQADANVTGFLSKFLVVSGLPLDLALSQLQIIRDRHSGWCCPQVHTRTHMWLRLAQRLHLEGPSGDRKSVV